MNLFSNQTDQKNYVNFPEETKQKLFLSLQDSKYPFPQAKIMLIKNLKLNITREQMFMLLLYYLNIIQIKYKAITIK